MIENVIPYPVGCETSRFFGALSSMHLAATRPQAEGLDHEFVFHVLYAVSGAGLLRLHQTSIQHQLKSYNTNEILGCISYYMQYAIRYAGYSYKRMSPGENEKDEIWAAIIQSIDKGIPVLMKLADSNQWNVVAGYREENCELLGLDAKEHYDKNGSLFIEPKGYLENGYYYDSEWFTHMDYAIICTPIQREISLLSAMKKMCEQLDAQLQFGMNSYILLLKKDDDFFKRQSDDFIHSLYGYVDSLLGFLMECSHHVSEAFGAVWKGQVSSSVINPRLQDLFSELDSVITNTQGVVGEHWNYQCENIEKKDLIRHKDYRDTLLSYLYRIAEDDRKALALMQETCTLLDPDFIDHI